SLTLPLVVAGSLATSAIPSVISSFALQVPLFAVAGLSRGLLRVTGSADAFEGAGDDDRRHGVAGALGIATMFRVVPIGFLALYLALAIPARRALRPALDSAGEERRVEEAPRHVGVEAGVLEPPQVLGHRVQRLVLAVGRQRVPPAAGEHRADPPVAVLPVALGADVVEVEEPAAAGEQRAHVAVAARERVRGEVVEGARADDEVGPLDPRRRKLLRRRDDERDPVAEV